MRALIERFVSGESGITAYGLIAAALMLVGLGAWVVAPAHHVVVSTQINPLEMMANAKDLPTSPAMANGPSATGARPPAAGGVALNPAVPGPTFQTETKPHYGTKHHKELYLSAKSIHKHRQRKPAPALPDLAQGSAGGNVN